MRAIELRSLKYDLGIPCNMREMTKDETRTSIQLLRNISSYITSACT